MNEIEKSAWELHDRRLNEHELRFNQGTRDFQEIKDVLKQLAERLNEGVSKTQQKILEENKQIEINMRDLTHAVEMSNVKLNDKIDTVHKTLLDRVEPLESSNRNRDKVYVWGVLAGLILGIVGFITKTIMEKTFLREPVSVEHVKSLVPKNVP